MWLKQVRIEVTAKDIREGKRGQCKYCPVALAVKRRFPDAACRVWGPAATDEYRGYTVEIEGGAEVPDSYWKKYRLDEAASQAIRHFDGTGEMEPFATVMERVM